MRRDRLPKILQPKKQTHTVTLKAVFVSVDGKASDDDAERFEKALRKLIENFKPKSEFKPPQIQTIKKWETTGTP